MNKRNKNRALAIATVLAGLLAVSVADIHAQVINTVSQVDLTSTGGLATDGTTLVEATPNLVNSASLSSSDFTGYSRGSTSNIASLNNGSLGTPGQTDPSSQIPSDTAVNPSGDWTLTVDLNTSSPGDTGGYDLNDIRVISGWTSGYVNQSYTLAYTTTTDSTLQTLGTFTASVVNVANDTGSDAYTLETSLTSNSGPLATNVNSLQFTFNSAAYREVEAFGTPVSAPEPSTWVMVFAGIVGLLGLRRLKRKA